MTEELEQLLNNLKLKRMLSVYDEQLLAAEKGQISYSEFVAGLMRAQWPDRQDSADAEAKSNTDLSRDKITSPASPVGQEDSESDSAGTLVAGVVPVDTPAGCKPQADAHVRRTRLRGET